MRYSEVAVDRRATVAFPQGRRLPPPAIITEPVARRSTATSEVYPHGDWERPRSYERGDEEKILGLKVLFEKASRLGYHTQRRFNAQTCALPEVPFQPEIVPFLPLPMKEFKPCYSDGHPLDEVHYREFKILLKANHFARPEGFEMYWKLIKSVGKDLGVGVHTNPDGFNHHIREVLFYDTPNYDLYNNAFILRKRTFYKDGWPEIDHELTVKFRHKDIDIAAAMEMRPHLEGKHKIKFKEELLPIQTELGGMRSLYSHNCELVTPNIILSQGLADITKVFPCMAKIDVHPETQINLVNNVAVEEVEVEVGHFDFGHGLEAKATIAIWRNRASETSLVGEFAFQCKFERVNDMHAKAKVLSEKFYRAIQTQAPEWVELGTTKTALVYGQGKVKCTNNE